jgi:hypothetical protein
MTTAQPLSALGSTMEGEFAKPWILAEWSCGECSRVDISAAINQSYLKLFSRNQLFCCHSIKRYAITNNVQHNCYEPNKPFNPNKNFQLLFLLLVVATAAGLLLQVRK